MPDCGRMLPVPVAPPEPLAVVVEPEMSGAPLLAPAEPVAPPDPAGIPPEAGAPGAMPDGGAPGPEMISDPRAGGAAPDPLDVVVPATSPSLDADGVPGTASDECPELSDGAPRPPAGVLPLLS